ncbi:MAG TPA: TonB-dependent receptor [Terriglobia bacterium]|nr:TonB-dependent receptor [Terriglobia bacterium]
MRFRAVSRLALWLVAISVLGFCSAQRLHAQILYGSVAGTVSDQTGAVVPGAAITIVNDNTGFTRNTTSASAGDYRLTDLPGGTYTLTVTAQGFKPIKQTGINVAAGSVNQQNVQLSVGAVTQEVTVSGAAAVLQTQQANVHTTISNYAVQNLPLNVYHNFQSVELLAPGVVSLSAINGAYPNSLADTPDRSLAINTNGLPQHVNTNRVDGATNVFLWLPDHMVIVPPAASVQEVNVQTSNYNVQKGLTMGAATDVITKGGTNQFHGNVYAYHTDASLDAQDPLVHTANGKAPHNIQNNDGVDVGGPIVKNKLFFFGNWDGYFQRQNVADQFLLAPLDMRGGDFSHYLGAPLYSDAAATTPIMVCTTGGGTTQLRQGMIFDPTTGDPNTGAGRCAFDNNTIPANRIYGGASQFWQLMNGYVPNDTPAGGFTENTANNDLRFRNSDWNRNIYTGKIDYNISDRQTIWGKYTLQKSYLNDGSDYGVAGRGNGTGISDQTAQTVTIGHTWTAKSDLVLSGHIGFTRMAEKNSPADLGTNYGQTVLGLTNSNTPTDDPRYSGMPGIDMGSFTTLGNNSSWQPVTRNDWQLTLDENATWIKGKHSIVFGFDASHNHMNHWQPEIVCCPRGYVLTTDYNTFLNLLGNDQTATVYDGTDPAGTKFNPALWNSVAAFDLGLANEVENGQQFIKATNKDWDEALYIGDTFRITPKLTIDAGLRWEYYPLITRDGVSKFEVYDAATNQLYLGGLGNNDTHLNNTPVGVTTSKTLFAPRLGLAYQLSSKTVVRAAFGMTYDTLPLERPLRGFWPYTIGADNNVVLAGVSDNVTRYLPYANFNVANNTVNNIVGSPVNGGAGLADGVPLIQAPTGFQSGIITPPTNVTIGTLAPGKFQRGYVEFWNFTLQRKLPGDVLLNVGYVGNHLVHEFNGRNADVGALGTGNDGTPLFAAFGRPQSSGTFLFNGYLDSHYNSLQVSLDRHVTHGLFLQGSYTYSKVIGYIDDEGWENGLAFNCTPSDLVPNGCQSLNRHTLSFDHTHVLKMAFIYNLPFGAGEMFANTNKAARAVLGGWQVNGILTGISGSPLYVNQGTNFLDTPGTSQSPDFAGGLTMTKGTGRGEQWFNPDAFTPVQDVRMGTSSSRGLSWLRGPGLMQLDLSLFRNFKLTERFGLKVRAETLNFTNTPHWSNPNLTCSITTAGVCGGSLGQITDAFGNRIFQLGAEISF